MNILYLISSEGGKAAGGHFNSLHQVSLEMAKTCEVKIIMLGKVLSPILKDNPYLNQHIQVGHGLKGARKLNKKFNQLFKDFVPDVIHCFDTNSLNRCLLSPATRKTPLVLNKCGGRNPLKSNYQHADATVVFSIENQQWYFKNKHYKNESIFLIPNRVRALHLLPKNEQLEKANPNKVTFLRVSRLGGAYEMTLLQTFTLLEKLNKTIDVELFVIGRIQDETRFQKLVSEGKKKSFKIHYITDERASKGSTFLYLADFVVGTGRSFMEATSLGIPSLTPAHNTNIPILIDDLNVERFLSTNFSERNQAQKEDEENTLASLLKLIKDKLAYQNHKAITEKMFNEYFGTEKINSKYTKVYSYVIANSINRTALFFKNAAYLLKFIIYGK